MWVTPSWLRWSTLVCAECVCVCQSAHLPMGSCHIYNVSVVREAKPHNMWSDKRGEDDRLKLSPTTATESAFSRVTILPLPAFSFLLCSVRYRYIFTMSWMQMNIHLRGEYKWPNIVNLAYFNLCRKRDVKMSALDEIKRDRKGRMPPDEYAVVDI